MNTEAVATSSRVETARSWRDEAVGAGRFGIVGVNGVAINVGVLVILSAIDVRLGFAAVLAIETSILWDFFWNDRWTFVSMHGSRPWIVRLGGYHLAVLAGGVVNYVLVLALAGPLSTLLAGAIGVSMAATLCWTSYSYSYSYPYSYGGYHGGHGH